MDKGVGLPRLDPGHSLGFRCRLKTGESRLGVKVRTKRTLERIPPRFGVAEEEVPAEVARFECSTEQRVPCQRNGK